MIRQFRLGDQKSIALLEQECFNEPWSENAILDSFENGTVFTVFEEKGSILGYAGMQTVLDEGYITNIAVTAAARGRGIGTTLVNELKDIAKKQSLSFITLEVRETNLAAIALYKKLGFKNMGKRKNFYKAPTEDAIIMTLEEI